MAASRATSFSSSTTYRWRSLATRRGLTAPLLARWRPRDVALPQQKPVEGVPGDQVIRPGLSFRLEVVRLVLRHQEETTAGRDDAFGARFALGEGEDRARQPLHSGRGADQTIARGFALIGSVKRMRPVIHFRRPRLDRPRPPSTLFQVSDAVGHEGPFDFAARRGLVAQGVKIGHHEVDEVVGEGKHLRIANRLDRAAPVKALRLDGPGQILTIPDNSAGRRAALNMKSGNGTLQTLLGVEAHFNCRARSRAAAFRRPVQAFRAVHLARWGGCFQASELTHRDARSPPRHASRRHTCGADG